MHKLVPIAERVLLTFIHLWLLSSCIPNSGKTVDYANAQITLTERAMNAAQEAITIGMAAELVHSAMQELAWRRYDCGSEKFGPMDIYVVGSQDFDYAGNLALEYELINGQYYLRQIASWEPYMLEQEVYYCEAQDLPGN